MRKKTFTSKKGIQKINKQAKNHREHRKHNDKVKQTRLRKCSTYKFSYLEKIQ